MTSIISSSLPIGITMGDAAGIGPEIIVKGFLKGFPAPTIVYGDKGVIQRTIQLLKAPLKVKAINHLTQAQYPSNTIEIIHHDSPLSADCPAGQVNATAGLAAYAYISAAAQDAMAGKLRAMVTAPINKTSLRLAGIPYPGHTEILAALTHTQDMGMMLVNNELCVLLVSIHVPLHEVPGQITLNAERRAIQLAHTACLQMGITDPRVAVAGLNPHAGESGHFGREEIDVIKPAIELAQSSGINVSGPWPGDTIFMRARQGEFDIVVAQYHDQGLIPIKYLGLDQGVNVTVGLPFIRTSVDHGTAFDIAGKGKANPSSLYAAFELALKMTVTEQVQL